jgi:enamine deaminase RidA (YjgF/YER057c/UK114 family)
MKTEQRLKELGIALPPASSPVANYVNAVRSGNLMFLSGKGPGYGANQARGKVGDDMTWEEAKVHARSTGLNLIAVMKAELGTLDRVRRVVKVLGMVNCTPDFADQPRVINGCSDLFVEVFGDRGRHARSAVGMSALPNGIPVEIECIIEVADSARARAARPAARRKAARKKVARKKR